MRKAMVIILLFALIACSGGGDGGDAAGPAPEANFEVVTVEKTTWNSHPSLIITVKNTGDATGYNVSCDAMALDAAGTIIDSAAAFFAGLGNIEVGQSALYEAVFFEIASHDDYTSLTYDCSWLTQN